MLNKDILVTRLSSDPSCFLIKMIINFTEILMILNLIKTVLPQKFNKKARGFLKKICTMKVHLIRKKLK